MKRNKTFLDRLLAFTTTLAVITVTLALMSKCAKAGEAIITWTAPTQNCNGTPLTNLTGYDLTYGQGRVPLGLTPLTYTVTGLTPGTWWFSMAAKNSTGDRSEFVTVEKTILANEFVVAQSDAFALVKRIDRLVLAKVGTVPVGTPCLADQTVNGKYVVPRSLVTWSGTVKPDVVVATCQ